MRRGDVAGVEQSLVLLGAPRRLGPDPDVAASQAGQHDVPLPLALDDHQPSRRRPEVFDDGIAVAGG